MLVPDARVAVAHGQMSEQELEMTILDFLDGEFDVLVSTTIIETGVDIPNVNTLIVHDADKMGLSQLYQLRGRVGRSNRIAYAYLTYQRDKVLSEVSEKRLQAIKEFTELGSGFKIAGRATCSARSSTDSSLRSGSTCIPRCWPTKFANGSWSSGRRRRR